MRDYVPVVVYYCGCIEGEEGRGISITFDGSPCDECRAKGVKAPEVVRVTPYGFVKIPDTDLRETNEVIP